MKLAYIVPEFPSVSETFILSQITGLLDAGHTVDIYAVERGPGDIHHPDVARYDLPAKTRYRRGFEVRGRGRRLIRAAAILGPALLLRPGLVRRLLTVARREGFHPALNQLFAAAPFCRGGYDVIVTHFGPTGNAWLWLREWTRAKYACAFYGYDVTSYPREHGASVYRELFQRGDLFLALSQHMAAQLQALGCDPARLVIHPLGVNTERFVPRSSPARSDGTFRVLSVARLVEKKGLADAINAVARATRQGVAVQYTIVGSGPLEATLRMLIDELGLAGCVTLAGAKTSDQVAALMGESDLFLLPSITAANGDQEGTPMCLLEAQASGLPVLSTRHSGIPEIVPDGKSGYLVPEHDVDALADRLRFLVEHPETRRQMSAYGRTRVVEGYDIRRLCARLEEIFAQVIRSGSAGADPTAAAPGPSRTPAGVAVPQISVIIATRNRAESLRETLASLSAQRTDGRFTYEVLVVDNGSHDGTAELVDALRAAYPTALRYVREERVGKPFALNTGIAATAGSLLVFTDDDVVADPAWLGALWDCVRETGADGVAGKIVPRWVDGRPEWLTDQVMSRLGTFGCLDLGPKRIVMTKPGQSAWWVGGNVAFNRALPVRAGGFDERRLRGQDAELYRRFRQAGATIVYEPTAVVHHKVGRDRLTPAYFRRWHWETGHYRAYSLPWRPYHAVSVMPLYCYRELGRWTYRWVRESLARESAWLVLGCECWMRSWWSVLVHRLRAWPRACLAMLTRKPLKP